MPFQTFSLHGSLLILAGCIVLYITTRVILAFSPEEAVPYRLSLIFKWAGLDDVWNQIRGRKKKTKEKTQWWQAVIWGIVISILLTLMMMWFSDYIRHLWTYVGGLPVHTLALVCVVLFPLKSSERRVFVGLFMIGTTVLLEIAPSWWAVNLAVVTGTFVSYVIFSVRTSFVQAAIVLGVIACLYDMPQVWLTHYMRELVERNILANSPGNLLIPTGLSSPEYMFLGFGDIFLPGLLVILAGRAGQRAGNCWLYRAALLGYTGGLTVAIVAGYFFGSQPTLIYLMISIPLATYLAARWTHLVDELKVKVSDTTEP